MGIKKIGPLLFRIRTIIMKIKRKVLHIMEEGFMKCVIASKMLLQHYTQNMCMSANRFCLNGKHIMEIELELNSASVSRQINH